MIGDRLIGPWELPSPLNGDNYLEFLRNDLPELLDGMLTRDKQDDIIFMHDGAPAHFAVQTREYLDERFQSWIGRGGTVRGPLTTTH